MPPGRTCRAGEGSLKADPFSESTAARYNLVAVSAVKVWLRDFSVLAGGIQAKAPAPHPVHQFLCLATMLFRHCSDGLRDDARDTAEL